MVISRRQKKKKKKKKRTPIFLNQKEKKDTHISQSMFLITAQGRLIDIVLWFPDP